jgi:hypothetical protein
MANFGLNLERRKGRPANLERLYTAFHGAIGGVGALKAVFPQWDWSIS